MGVLQRSGTWFAALSCAIIAGPSAAGSGPTPFSEAGIARGINYTVSNGALQLGAGLGLFDLDADGDPDALVLGALDGKVGLYENDGTGHFTDRSSDNGTYRMANHTDYAGVSAADFDGDGDLDVYLSRYGAPNKFYRNDGGWVFTDISVSSGLADPGHSLATLWADCNADGRLDVYVSNRTGTNTDPTENAFYENNEDGTFSEKASLVGIERPGDPTLVAAFFDYDADSDPDLYLGTDKGALSSYTNHLFRNDGGMFTDVTTMTGTEANVDCMGIAIGDINHDGWFDLYMTNIPIGHVLLISDGGRSFSEQTAAAGMEAFELGWGTLFFDFDNDTWEDAYVCHTNARNMLFRNNEGVFPMTEMGQAMNVGTTGTSFCVASADIDADGDLDLLVGNLGDRVKLYINNEGSLRNWAAFDVVGRDQNVFAIGAQVRVLLDGESVPLLREVRAGHNYKAQEPTTIHFGLGDAPSTGTITVNWPNSTDQRVLTGYPANHRWALYPPERMGDADLDGDVDVADQQIAYDRFMTNGPEPVTPGIEMLDIDGDGDFDADDMAVIGIPCQADLAEPFGTLDLSDINMFVVAFVNQDPVADLDGDGLFDLTDLSAFVTSFLAGCP